MDEEQQRKHEAVWERYVAAKQRELEACREGQLGRIPGVALPDE